MTKVIVTLAAVLISSVSFASTPDFSILSRGGGEMEKVHACMGRGWRAAQPTEDQTQKLHEFLGALREVFEQNKENMHQAMHNMMHTWMQHPVVLEDVQAAQGAMQVAMAPVKNAGTTTMVNIINLLSGEQREVFNQAFMECMHE